MSQESKDESLKLLLIGQVSFWFRMGLISPVLSLFIRRVGASLTDIGLLGATEMVGFAIFEPTFGYFADRLGKKRLAIYSIVATSFIFLAYTFASSTWHFYLIAFAFTSNMSAGAVSMRAMTIDLLPISERGKTYGRFMALAMFGQAVAPFIGGFLADAMGVTAPFYLAAGLGFIGIAAFLPMKYGEIQRRLSEQTVTSNRSKLLTKPFLNVLFIRLLFTFGMNFQRGALPIFLHENPRLGASQTEIGFFMGLNSFASALSQLFLGTLTDRMGSKKIMIFGLGMSGLSYLSLIYLNDVALLYLLGILQGTLSAAADLSMMIYLMTVIPKYSSSRAMGAYGFSEDLGGIVASSSLGIIYDRLGPNFSIISVSIVLILNAFLSTFLIKIDDKLTKQI